MDIIPHVDIVGDDRIQTILDDPKNFELRAIRAETLQDWMPDLGTYAAPSSCRMQNGIFRTSGLAKSGIPAILRHRFFIHEEAVAVTGTRYIGLLIYDGVDDDYVFELSAGSEDVGAVRPWRHDNRRHLIVATVPAQILGGHIPFTVCAVGTGRCYLESVLFMQSLPETPEFTPRIERLSARVVARRADGVTADVDFVTREAAMISVTAVTAKADAKVYAETDAYDVLHTVVLRGLQEGRRYEITVEATEPGGAYASATTTLSTAPPVASTAAPVHVPVEILWADAVDVAGLPLTFGVPVARGSLVSAEACEVRAGGWSCVGQARVHARWPDGSARWVLVDVPAPELPDSESAVAAEVVVNPAAPAPAVGLSWQEWPDGISAEGGKLRVRVSRGGPLPAAIERRATDGSWHPLLTEGGTCLTAVLGNEVCLANGQPEALLIEESGPERVVIRYELPIIDDRGAVHFRTEVRLHIFARMPFVRLVARTTVVSPALGPALGSADLSHLTEDLAYLRSAVGGERGEATSLLRVASMELRLPWIRISDGTRQRVIHEHDWAYRVERAQLDGTAGESESVDGHWPGILEVDGDAGRLGICVRDFWQTYPKALRCDGRGVAIEILPQLSGTALPEEEELWHRLYFWRDPTSPGYRLKVGMALTADVLIGVPGEPGETALWQRWLQGAVVVRPAPDYLNATEVFLPMAIKALSPHPVYEAFMDQAIDDWLGQVAERHEYGFANYGDTYSDGEHFWSNNEYDGPLCAYLEFLRGGDPRWAGIGTAGARHQTNVDTCNYSRVPSQIGAQYVHTPGHAGGYLPPFFRSKTAGSAAVPSHMWVEGSALHYLLTGDAFVGDTIRQTGLRLTRGLKTYDFMNMREPGWLTIHLCGMARMVESPRFENAAAVVVGRVLDKQEPGGGWEHPLSEGHCHCVPPRCHGEAGFMVGVVLSALRRFHALTGDPRVGDAIVGGVRWLIEKTYVPEVGHFRYTSCPNHGDPGPVYTLQVIEGLADATMFSRDPVIAAVLRRALSDIGQPGADASAPRYGRSLSMEARYIPFMLYVLNDLDLGT